MKLVLTRALPVGPTWSNKTINVKIESPCQKGLELEKGELFHKSLVTLRQYQMIFGNRLLHRTLTPYFKKSIGYYTNKYDITGTFYFIGSL